MNQEEFGFTVDTHLFRELGELLVGRDSTALIELIKNAYDADATTVVVRAENLGTTSGRIIVADNGIGMTSDVFKSAFLRIAGRYKEHGDRRSPRFRRRYTGAKGVGRLSAHKLAQRLTIESMPRLESFPPRDSSDELEGIRAVIDWRSLEDRETLDDVGDALSVQRVPINVDKYGTTLLLQDLRRAWKPSEITRFVTEVTSSRPARILLEKPADDLLSGDSLFGELHPWTIGTKDPGFTIKYQGEIQTGDSLWLELAQRTNWLVEIDASSDGVIYSIQPTSTHLKRAPEARPYVFRRAHPDPASGPFFQSRIYAREYGLGERASALAKFGRSNSGVRVYLEGFRVLPYGDPNDDWLGIARDYARRQHGYLDITLDEASSRLISPVEDEGFSALGNDQYIGAVFLTADGSASLRPVVNREGFVDDDALQTLRELVRNGVDLLTRVRVSTREQAKSFEREIEREQLEQKLTSPSTHKDAKVDKPGALTKGATPRDDARVPLEVARLELKELRSSPTIDHSRIDRIEAAVSLAENIVGETQDERAMYRVLAGVGLQFTGFVHEINGLLGLANSVRTLASSARHETDSRARSQTLRELEAAVDELGQSLTRQSSYLVDIVGPDARRRRRRLPLNRTVEATVRLLTSTLEQRNIRLILSLDGKVKTPPVFPAEMTIIYTNLLTNAVKATADHGQILVAGGSDASGGVRVRVENTGTPVDLKDGERWFRPFESTTTELDVVLGQGMGLGLPITRRLLADYGGNIRFVTPSSGYATALEFFLPPREVGK